MLFGKNLKIFGRGMNKVKFILPYVKGKNVLDIGVVAHVSKTYYRPNWLHKHIYKASKRCVGIDILKTGVKSLTDRGFEVYVADAQSFSLSEQFDVIVAGDILEHLHDTKGFF